MQLSTKGRYAVMALADLAAWGSANPVPLAAIAERQSISLPYLEQLFMKLRFAGLVNSTRGPGGGYSLARRPDEVLVAQIMQAVDEPVKMTRCHDDQTVGCIGVGRCLTHDLWRALGEHIFAFLESVTLRDVIDKTVRLPQVAGDLAASAEAREGAKA